MRVQTVNTDTEKLLRECDSGAKMAVKSIDEVLDEVESEELRRLLVKSKEEHDAVKDEIKNLLEKTETDEKEPSAMAEAMSWLKINAKMLTNKSDKTIADLMSEGCSMGIRSLCGYKNEYTGADSDVQEIAKRLIELESDLVIRLREFL